MSEGAYVVTDMKHKRSASHNGINDLNHAHDPKLASKFSLIGVMILRFPWYHPPPPLNLLHPAIGFYLPRCLAQYYF